MPGLLHPVLLTDPHHCFYLVLSIRGELIPQVLQAAFDDVVARHSALRTRYAMTPSSGVVQEVFAQTRGRLTLRNASGESVEAAIAALTYMKVPLHEPPLMKLEYVRLGAQEGLLGIAIHHLACDATGLVLAVDELAQAYNLRRRGEQIPPCEFGYGDYAVWQRQSTAERWHRDVAAWRAHLKTVSHQCSASTTRSSRAWPVSTVSCAHRCSRRRRSPRCRAACGAGEVARSR